MKIVTIIGARPQFIKAWPVSRALADAGVEEHVIHTGQHYDHGMSGIFFEQLGMREPDTNLSVGSGSQGVQTARMLEGVERVLLEENPDVVLLYGDTNSTVAGALAAVKLHIPIAHVEAGLRSFNRRMPEEHNRIISDHCSDLLFCPTETAVFNLRKEGLTKGVYLSGDVMHDAVLMAKPRADACSTILTTLGVAPKTYALATLHRAENVDHEERLKAILLGLDSLGVTVIFPVHPRTRGKINALEKKGFRPSHLWMIDPVGYLDMIALMSNSRAVLTDSGGLQKEAVWLGTQCITMREETEWVETLATGENILVGANTDRINNAFNNFETFKSCRKRPVKKEQGKASQQIAAVLIQINK